MRRASRRITTALVLLGVVTAVAPEAHATTITAAMDRTTLETPAGPATNCAQGGVASAGLPGGGYGPITARVTLRFNDTELGSRGGSSWGYSVTFTVAPIDSTGAVTGTPTASTLSIFRGLERESFEAVAVIAPWMQRGARLCVTGFTGPDLAAVPSNITLALSVEGVAAMVFNTTLRPTITLQTDRATLANLPAGANAYEFEWTYADRLDPAGLTRDPVRVRSATPSFGLDLAYPAGKLQVRGRALNGAGATGAGDAGAWSFPLSVSIDPACGSQPNCVAPVDPSLNWRYLGTYSQGSAAASSFTVFDSVLRSRQTQQRMRSQAERLVSETPVDREGRGRLQMLPAPLDGERYGYAPSFNAAVGPGNSVVPYDYQVFDGVTPPAVSSDRGAGKYYSSNSGPNANPYTPDAEGYPFSANEPVRDTSARLRRAGAQGAALALGKGRESRFRYGTADSSTLRRLFGRNVGRAANYERTLQIDQNGQAHAAYVDGDGKAIATALAGDTPPTLLPIDRTLGNWLTYSLNENNSIDVHAGTSRSVNTVLTTAMSNLFFSYRLGGVEWSTPGVNGFPAICESCRYRLRVRITDMQGNAVPMCKGVTRTGSGTCSCADPEDELVEDMGNPAASLPYCALNGDDARSTVSTVGSPLQFCAQLPEGEFEVVKHLEVVNDVLLQTLTDATTTTTFVTTHGPRPPETDSGRMCGTNCESFCESAAQDPTRSTPAYGACLQTCRDPTSWAFNASSLQSCNSLQSRLDADLAPGGLYAGQAQHPEQCHVAVCRARNDPAHNSDAFDDRMMKVERHAEALCRGYLDPLQGTTGSPVIPASCAGVTRERDPAFEPGGYGAPVRTWMDDALRDYAATMPGFPQVTPPGLAGKTLWVLAAEPVLYTDAANPNGRTPSLDEQWRMFRSLYFGAKQTALTQHTEQGGCAFLESPDARVKRSSAYNSAIEVLNALAQAQADFCTSLCETRVSNWISTLRESCPAMRRTSRGLSADLGEYCRSSCGPANPLATITRDALRNDKFLLRAAGRLPEKCSLDVLVADPPFTTGSMCRPEFPPTTPGTGSTSSPVAGRMLASGGGTSAGGGALSPAARDLLLQACHVVPNGVNPSHTIPHGPTPGDQLELCEQQADDLAAQQQFLLLENARTSFLTRARELNHERCLGARFSESFSYEAAPNEYHYTLRYYDQAGDLVQTVPPKGIRALTSQQVAQLEDADTANDPASPAHELVTRYQYDSAGQVVRRRSPDSGETRYWYNRAGQLRFSQTSQQEADRRYAYLRYDARGRLVESGLVAGVPTVADLVAMFAVVGTPVTEVQVRELLNWLLRLYGNQPVTPVVGGAVSTEEVITRTYDQTSSACGTFAAQNLRGRLSAVVAKTTLGDVATCYSYDPHGNIASLLQRVPQLGDKRVDYEYDILDGKILSTHYQPGTDEALRHRFTYDDDRRLVSVETSRNGELWERDAAYGYYRHGPISRLELGADRVQGVDYLHSINGWPKGVNADSLDPSRDPGHDGQTSGANRAVARDAFGSAVHYFPGDYTPAGLAAAGQAAQPQMRVATRAAGATVLSALMVAGCVTPTQPDLCGLYDGSPNAAVYAVSGFATPVRGASYRYDQLNRLRSADSFAGADLAANAWPTTTPATGPTSPWRSSLQYDPNGNITQLERTAADPAGVVAGGVPMDQLTYRYPSDSNRLLHINDGVLANRFDEDIDDQGTPFIPGGYANYSYDLGGRPTRDGAAGLNAIRWNSGNRVQSIDRTDDTLEYVYDGLGQRIAKITRAGLDPNAWQYEFFVRDEKGEILATYRKLPPSVLSPVSRTVLVDQTIRGSRRLGILRPALMSSGPIPLGGVTSPPVGIVNTGPPQPTVSRHDRVRGARQYELANHFENVYATIEDRKQEVFDAAAGGVTHYQPVVANRYDYDPFGSALPERREENAAYRYGFSGLERDDELKGTGNSYYTNARLFDPRVGRWLSPDAIEAPDSSPFVGFANNPLRFSDPTGNAPGDSMEDKQRALINLQKSDSKSVANNAVWTAKQDRYSGLTSEAESAWRSIDFGDWWAENVEKPVIAPVKVGIRWTLGIADPTGIVEAKMDESDQILNQDTSGGETATALRGVAGVAFGHVPLSGVAREALAVERTVAREANAVGRGAIRDEAALERGLQKELAGAPCVRPGGSFEPSTLVHTDRGPVAIGELRVGDVVLSGDEVTGVTGWRRVTDVFGLVHASSIKLATSGPDGTESEIVTTDEHPFWVEGSGWTPAGEIRSPARIRVSTGWHLVTSAETVPGEVETLNLAVEGFHTFYVGDQQAWVHNCNPIGGVGYVGSLPKPRRGDGLVPQQLRDPKRVWYSGERAVKRATQGNQCATGCGTKINKKNSRGHHVDRHADGGLTDDLNHAEVCKKCHDLLHSP